MRCMTAIWPAGPPKLRLATLSQTRNASPRLGKSRRSAAGGGTGISSAAVGLIDDIVRPWFGNGRDSLACRLVGRSLPHGGKRSRADAFVKCGGQAVVRNGFTMLRSGAQTRADPTGDDQG